MCQYNSRLRPLVTGGAPGFPGPIKLGSQVEFSIPELAQRVCRRTTRSSASPTSRARQMLSDWTPKVQLDEGLGPTIAYFDELLSSSEHDR